MNEEIMQKLEEHSKKFVEHDKQFDRIINKLIEQGEEIKEIKETMATKAELREIKTILESVAVGVKKIQEDDVAKGEWLKRLQKNDERQDKDISQIKVQLKMA